LQQKQQQAVLSVAGARDLLPLRSQLLSTWASYMLDTLRKRKMGNTDTLKANAGTHLAKAGYAAIRCFTRK
jgi:hypothetical protein